MQGNPLMHASKQSTYVERFHLERKGSPDKTSTLKILTSLWSLQILIEKYVLVYKMTTRWHRYQVLLYASILQKIFDFNLIHSHFCHHSAPCRWVYTNPRGNLEKSYTVRAKDLLMRLLCISTRINLEKCPLAREMYILPVFVDDHVLFSPIRNSDLP